MRIVLERPWEVPYERRDPHPPCCVVCGATSDWTDLDPGGSGGGLSHDRCRGHSADTSSVLRGALANRHHRRPTRCPSRRHKAGSESRVAPEPTPKAPSPPERSL